MTMQKVERLGEVALETAEAIGALEIDFAVAVRQRELLEAYIRERMKPDIHFYKVRGGGKNSLTKEGAELVSLPHGLKPKYDVLMGPQEPPADTTVPYQITVKCGLYKGDIFGGEGMGSASSIKMNRQGNKEPRQKDPGLCHNSTLKMAMKSAYIAATLSATAASEFFTQDMEEVQSPPAPPPTPTGPRPASSPDYMCAEHGVEFFKRGKMKGYAHPIKDKKGNDTGEWHNMPEEQDDTSSPQAKMYCHTHKTGYSKFERPEHEQEDGLVIPAHTVVAHKIRGSDPLEWCYENPADEPGGLFPHTGEPPLAETPPETHEAADTGRLTEAEANVALDGSTKPLIEYQDLYNLAHERWGKKPDQVQSALGVVFGEDIKDLGAAWERLETLWK